MTHRRTHARGFTLLELLIVLGIVAVITGIGTTKFIQMTGYWSDLRNRTELDRRAESAFARIKKDLAAVIAPSLSTASIEGTSGNITNEAGELFFNMPLADDTLSIPTLAPDGAGNAVPVVVTYSIDRENSKNAVLVRTQRALGDKEGGQGPQTIAQGVIQFRVEYTANGSDWVAEWSERALPRAIRVSLNLAVPGDPLREQVAREQVLPVHVQ